MKIGLCLALAATSTYANQATLSHSAPLLGGVLELRLEGAAPGAEVTLFVSARPGDKSTPWGTLELDRTRLAVAASGFANASGEFTFASAIPADPLLAETPRHFQALVEPAGAPAELSQAVHLRLLGSRAYVLCAGTEYAPGGEEDGGLAIVSLVRQELVATVELGAFSDDLAFASNHIEPVFDASFSRGAFLSSATELVLFEPFFGRVLQRIPFQGAALEVLASSDGARLFVLDEVWNQSGTSAKVHVLDFASGQSLAVVPLGPQANRGGWIADPQFDLAYIPVADGTSQPAVRRFDLAALADLGTVTVGSPTCLSVHQLVKAGDLIAIATSGLGFPTYAGALTRLRETGGAPAIDVSSAGLLRRIEPVPALDALALWSPIGFAPGGYLRLERRAVSTGPLPLPVPNGGGVIDLQHDSSGLWVLSNNSGISGGYSLAHYEGATQQWLDAPSPWWHDVPRALALVDDAQGERVCIAASEHVEGSTVYHRARLTTFDPMSGSWSDVAVPPGPISIRAIAVP